MEHELSPSRKVFATIGIGLALFLASLDQSIVGNAMPRIVSEFNGLEHFAWVVTSYLVASTTMTPISGKLGDLFGRKPLLLVGMGGLVAASALCGQSRGMGELIAFRGLQGLFAGTLMACVFASLGDIYPMHVRARMTGMFTGIFGLSSVVGPTLGGYLTDTLGWRWVFYVNVPVGALAITAVALALPARPHRASWRDIDFAGAAALAATLVPMLIAFSLTREHGFASALVLGLLVFAAAMAAAFFVIEQRAAHPMVPFTLWKNRTFAISMLGSFCVAFAMFGAIVYISLVYQGVLGIPATDAGLLITPLMVGLMITSTITGPLMGRVKRYRFIGTAGTLATTIGLFLLSRVVPGTPRGDVVRDLVLIGAGIGATMPLYTTAVMSALPPQFLGVASSQAQFWRNIGSTVGVSILGAVMAHQLATRMHNTLSGLGLPPALQGSLGAGANAQALFDPAHIAAARAALPPALQGRYDAALLAVRHALAGALGTVFLYATAVGVLAVVFSLLLREVPLRSRMRRSN
jgi:EmrB/QacA subfamily drug resistance transporter